MSAGATRNYKVGPKNNWRRTVWNEVLSRTKGREKTEDILYLAGPQDLDRAIAIEKGVPTQRLIAIDMSSDNVESVRENKVPAITANIHDVLRSWPANRPVCAVILDYCCGLTTDVIDVYDLFERTPLRNAVVMVNFMRGRDHFSNAIREAMTRSVFEPIDPNDEAPDYPVVYMVGGDETFHLSEKHRALQFMVLHAIETWQAVLKMGFDHALQTMGFSMNPAPLPEGVSMEEMEETIGQLMMHRVFQAMRPKFYSYKSGALTFDSAVFQHIARSLQKAPPSVQKVFAEEIDKKYIPDQATARKISAMLAVRTMRQ